MHRTEAQKVSVSTKREQALDLFHKLYKIHNDSNKLYKYEQVKSIGTYTQMSLRYQSFESIYLLVKPWLL